MTEIQLPALILAIAFWLSGFWFLFRIRGCSLISDRKNYLTVTLIIPARNEESNIGKLLDSINNQDIQNIEVIVVNDGSTDRTKEIALSKGASVIDSGELPKGWLGKPWACMQGASAAKGDVLIFLDSDTELEPNGLRKLLDSYMFEVENHGPTVMSVSPFHKVKYYYEDFSSLFNIIMNASMNAFTPVRNAIPAGLFGQSLILSKADYFGIGGHEQVKDKILENMFLAEKFKASGIRLKCLGGRGTLSFRMYPHGFADLVNGWSKAFASGAARIPFASLLNIILWISAGFIIAIFSVRAIFNGANLTPWLALYFAFALQILWMMKRLGSFKIFSAMIYPLHFVFFCFIFGRSLYIKLFNKKVSWKARDISS